ncbi:hypothetical protein KFE98_03425 [bacterium SCSIO 12741]|nr:hypothetical protein KFE98_03425 [bacterium SCSIO 12741]
MKKKVKQIKEIANNIKVRLDHRTVITLKDMEALAFWKEKYPQLEIISVS